MLYSWNQNNINYSSSYVYFPSPQQGGDIEIYHQISNFMLYYTYISSLENLNNYINNQGLFDFSNASPNSGVLNPSGIDKEKLPSGQFCIVGTSSSPLTGTNVYYGLSSTFPIISQRNAYNGLYNWYLSTGTNLGSANTGRVYSVNSSKGSYIQNVYSINENQYPVNGTQGGYWYGNKEGK